MYLNFYNRSLPKLKPPTNSDIFTGEAGRGGGVKGGTGGESNMASRHNNIHLIVINVLFRTKCLPGKTDTSNKGPAVPGLWGASALSHGGGSRPGGQPSAATEGSSPLRSPHLASAQKCADTGGKVLA